MTYLFEETEGLRDSGTQGLKDDVRTQGLTDSRTQGLERELARIVDSANAKVGIGVIHLESGREIFVNGREGFLLASTYKIPIAVEVLTRVDRGELRLDSLVRLEAADIVPFGSLLTDRFGDGVDPGASLAVRRYLELMLILSDNTATDVLLRLIGGTAPVRARLAALGIEGLKVNRTVMELGAEWFGLELPERSERSVAGVRELMASVKPPALEAANRAFYANPKDHGTPEAMTRFLVKIWRREALSPQSTDLLLDIMRRDETGNARLKGRLPPGITVANKTGTVDNTVTNDVGIIYLPDGSHVAVAVYTKESTAPAEADRERVIADIGRAIYDFFLLADK
jgi:beta-lactamase class A